MSEPANPSFTPLSHFTDLPPEVLSLIRDQESLLQEKNALLRHHDALMTQLKMENELLREALRLARMRQFASTSEKLPSTQGCLFNEAELHGTKEEGSKGSKGSKGSEDQVSGDEVLAVPAHTRVRPKRKPLPDHLPREEVVIDLPEDQKICPEDGSRLKEIGSEISEQLDYVPAQLKVIRTIRKKYACPCCEETLWTAALPLKILPKSNAAPGLLAHVAVSKYVDALPLYRLEGMFKRLNIDLSRQTMASWMIALSEKLQAVYNLMEEDWIASDDVCCDETTVQVLKESGKKAQSLSFMWVRARHGPGISPIVLFDYDPTRSGEVPKRLLRGFRGYLQVDGYAGYDEVCRQEGVLRVGCLAHIRRKFFEAYKVCEKKGSPADGILQQIQGLYKIEERIGDLSVQERKKIRGEYSVPILWEMKRGLDENEGRHPPQGLLGKAISYGLAQWGYLTRYLEDGRLSIDNNFIENRIRPFAVGRKNWLFADTVAGAEASALQYSILQTARANGLEPYAYLRYLLTHLPTAQTVEEIEPLLPYKIDPKKI